MTAPHQTKPRIVIVPVVQINGARRWAWKVGHWYRPDGDGLSGPYIAHGVAVTRLSAWWRATVALRRSDRIARHRARPRTVR